MPLNSAPRGKSNKIYVIAAYKENRQVGYLFWHSKADSPKTLRVAGRASSNIATWSSYQKAELALNDRVAGRLITAKDNLESEGYELKIVEFG